MYRTTLRIDGMACGACEMKAESALKDIGARNIHIDVLSGETDFETDQEPDIDTLVQAIRKVDFRPFNVCTEKIS